MKNFSHKQIALKLYDVSHQKRRESLRYLSFIYSEPEGGVNHRMTDPRGNPEDPPVLCACDEPVIMNRCKRKGAKGSQKNVGRHFWSCQNPRF